jgi:RimJ/RimL family protein N-acetyltransferase
MKPTLRGELVVLRPIRADDAEAMWEMVTDPEGSRLTGRNRTSTREEIDDWCARAADEDGRIDWAITHGSDEYLGEIVLNQIDTYHGSANLRMAMRPGQRGRGFGKEATELALTHAFGESGLALHRVYLEVLSINPRAMILYESLGFVIEGRLRDSHRNGEFWCDSVVMSMLEDDHAAALAARADR